MVRYCVDCAIKDVLLECPLNPDNKGEVTLNLVEVVPSPSSSTFEPVVPMKGLTRAQVKKDD